MSAKILVIDDETNIRTMIKLALAHVGYDVEAAADGSEGLDKFGDGNSVDLVLLDQRMPGLSGVEVLRRMLAIKPKAKVIMITAFGTIDFALEAIQAGAADFLRKPFTAEILRTSVRTALDRKSGAGLPSAVGLACREFSRTAINGFSFELDADSPPNKAGDVFFVFRVSKGNEDPQLVTVTMPSYVMELVKAYSDTEEMPGGERFWQAMCEEALANHLWQNAEVPADNALRIEDLSTSLQNWLDSVLTVPALEEHAL